jgi:hypothetical protein
MARGDLYMAKEEDVVYRKSMSEAERTKTRAYTQEMHIRSHAAEGAFAGFMLFTVISRLSGATALLVALLGAIGAGFGALVGRMEASARERRLKANGSLVERREEGEA